MARAAGTGLFGPDLFRRCLPELLEALLQHMVADLDRLGLEIHPDLGVDVLVAGDQNPR